MRLLAGGTVCPSSALVSEAADPYLKAQKYPALPKELPSHSSLQVILHNHDALGLGRKCLCTI